MTQGMSGASAINLSDGASLTRAKAGVRPGARFVPPRRSVNGVSILADMAMERGLPLRELFAGTGLDEPDLKDPSRMISLEEEYRVIRNLQRHCGNEAGLGFEAGSRYRFTTLGSLGFALVSSPTLRKAFEISVRYADLGASLIRVVLDAEGRDLRAGFKENELPADLRQFAVERTMAVGLTIYRYLLGRPVIPRAMDFTSARPSDVGVYERFAGVTPSFGMPKSLLILKEEDVEEPLVHGNAMALRMAEEHCQQLLEAVRVRGGLAEVVRQQIAARSDGIADMSTVASALCMSERTLRRRLQDEGTTYLELCDRVRESMAERLLTLSRLPVDQIADRLGYSEPASFIHAFKRWKGRTPKAFRAASFQTELRDQLREAASA